MRDRVRALADVGRVVRFAGNVAQKGWEKRARALRPHQWGWAYRSLREEWRRAREAQLPAAEPHLEPWQAWVEYNTVRSHVRELLAATQRRFDYEPTISVIVPVYNIAPEWLTAAVDSVRQQIYPHWQLCITDDASTDPAVRAALAALDGDPRIRVVFRTTNGNICTATNDAAARASGEFLAFLDQDDLLAPNALFEIALLLQTHRDADVIYSDEDKIAADGSHYDLHFKPDWSPLLLLGFNYINHLTCVRRSLFEAAGGLRPGYENAQDYDLLLRLSEQTTRIHHIPKVLYHWRAVPTSEALQSGTKPIVAPAAAALADHLARRGIEAKIYRPAFAVAKKLPIHQLDWPDRGPSVEVIVPTFNRVDLLRRCIESLLDHTSYRDFRVMVVDNDSDCPKTIEYLTALRRRGCRIERIANDAAGFSFSRVMNEAVRRSTAEFVVLLNNDTEIIEPRWLSRLIGYAQLPGVGATGARLLYRDRAVQHGGIVLNLHGGIAPAEAFREHPADQLSYFFQAETTRECAAVTGACLLVRRETFLDLGGLDEAAFRISLNDVDFCLRLQQRGLRVVCVAGAELIHRESATRNRDDDPAELAHFRAAHGRQRDEFYSPNLSTWSSFALGDECTLDYARFRHAPLRVMFFTHNLNLEGSPRVLVQLAEGLAGRERIAPSVAAFAGGPLRSPLTAAGIPVHLLTLPGSRSILEGWRDPSRFAAAEALLRRFLLRERPEVIVANVLHTYFVVHVARKLGIPGVWWIHESFDRDTMLREIGPEAFPDCERAFAAAQRVVFVSRGTRFLYERYNRRRNFTVVPTAIDRPALLQRTPRLDAAGARARLRVPHGRTVIVTVGTVCERKNQSMLVLALARLARRKDFHAFIVGARESVPYVNVVRRLIREHGLAKRVTLVPETDAVHLYYRAADIFAFTSRNESYPLCVLEAMAHGLPIVSTNCIGVSEQVRFGYNALEVGMNSPEQLAARLGELLDDPVRRRRMGAYSRTILDYQVDRDEMLARYEQIFEAAWQTGGEGTPGAEIDAARPVVLASVGGRRVAAGER